MTQYILGGLILLAVAATGLVTWVRSLSVPPEAHHVAGEMPAVGDHPRTGGFTTVRRVAEPQAALRDLVARIERTPRTTPLAGSVAEGHASFVTRSRVWGFPDVTNVWTRGDLLAIRGSLVIGRGDLGVNRRRIERWLADVPALSAGR